MSGPELSFRLHCLFVVAAALVLLASSGCVTPLNTQFPSLYAMDPKIERQRNEQFDPFASSDYGPSTMSRQRDHRPRDYERRTVDNAMSLPNFRGNRRSNVYGQPGYPPGMPAGPPASAPAFVPQPQIQPVPDPNLQGPTITPF